MIKTSPANELSSWRTRVLSVGLMLSLLAPITLLLVASTIPVADASPDPGWWNSSWTRRRPITITGSHPESYQMKINIPYDDDMHSDYADLRFLENETTGELSYWIENYTADNATVWVRREKNSDSTIYVYYGNPSATSAENADAVFELFDDFEGASLDINKWDEMNSGTGSISLSDGILTIASSGDWWSTSDTSRSIVSKSSFNFNYIAEAFVVNHGQDSYNRFFGLRSSSATNARIFVLLPDSDRSHITNVYRDSDGGSAAWYGNDSGISNPGNNKIAKFERIGNTVKSYYDNQLTNQRTVANWNLVHVSLTDTNTATNPTKFDWVRVRKYTSLEPTYTIGSEEVAIPSQPQLQQPVNNDNTNDNTPTFQWIIGQNADNHRLIVDNDPNFADGDNWIDITLGAAADTYTAPADNSLADGKWYWKVVAINPQGENSSDVWDFIVDKTPPLAPSLSSPDNNDNTDDNQVTFAWAATTDNTANTSDVSNIAHYELWVDNDPDFSSPLVTENTSDNSTLSLTREIVGRLYWRVRAWDCAGNPGTFSETRYITIFNFSLDAISTTLQIMRGSSGSTALSIDLVFGDIENVELDNEWIGIQPSSIAVDFSPQENPVSFDSTLNFVCGPSATTGTFTCRVKATSESGIERTVDIQITIYGMLFSITGFPRTLSLMRSDDSTVIVSVEFDQGALENVSLAGTWIGSTPAGISVKFNPDSGTPPYDSTVTIATTSSADGGSFTYRVSGTGSGLTRRVDFSINILTNLTLTLTTDRSSYEKGQEIQISGTVIDPKGNPVESGEATITLKSGNWADQLVTQITDGTYVENYYITFDKPEGNWAVSVSAVDSHGNLTQAPENTVILVSTPASWKYYTVTFLSPVPGTVCSRGSEITITVQITGSPEKISEADVYLAIPSGEIITLTEGSPGIYSTTYVPKWDDPVGEWIVSVLGEKTVQDVYKAGTGTTSLKIAPANLELELLEPSQRTFEIGEEVDVKVRVSYPDGSPVDGAIVATNLPNGENLTLLSEGEGIYRGAYSVSSKDLGAWGLTVSAVDAYGNSGTSSEVTLSVEELSPSSYPIRYWWITIPVVLACVLVPLPTMIKKLRIRKLKSIKSEIRATEKLRRELPKRYFVKGAISREIYDSLMHQSMEKLVKLKKEATKLKKRLEKS